MIADMSRTNKRIVISVYQMHSLQSPGKASHAAAPWEGINALDAAVQCYNNMSMLRQQMKPSCRMHAIISDGGQKPNIIPQKAQLKCYVRAPDNKERDAFKQKVIACAEGAAQATGRQIGHVLCTNRAKFYCFLFIATMCRSTIVHTIGIAMVSEHRFDLRLGL